LVPLFFLGSLEAPGTSGFVAAGAERWGFGESRINHLVLFFLGAWIFCLAIASPFLVEVHIVSCSSAIHPDVSISVPKVGANAEFFSYPLCRIRWGCSWPKAIDR
jgi:hypothetical protein